MSIERADRGGSWQSVMEFLKGETAGKGGRGYSKLSPVRDIDDLICLLRVHALHNVLHFHSIWWRESTSKKSIAVLSSTVMV